MAAGQRSALIAAVVAGGVGCSSEAWVVVSDLHGDGWFVTDLASGAVAAERSTSADFPDACGAEDRDCLVYQSRPHRRPDGDTEVVVTFSPTHLRDGASAHDPENNGQIVGYPLDAGPPLWQVDRLDWSVADPDARICRRDPVDPCAAAPDTTDAEARACAMYWPHDVHVLGEDDGTLHLLVADTRNARVLWMDVIRGARCAVVTEVLSGANPDWDIYTSVNAVDPWEDAGGRHLLASVKDTRGGEQQGGDGRGKIVQFSDAGDGWRQDWEFPPASTERPRFVASPHGVSHDADNVYFAHSLGRAGDWDAEWGGSVGVLDRDGGYRYDGVVETRWLGFPRDVTPLADGRLVVVDSGRKGVTDAPAPTHLYVVRPPATPPVTAATGDWSADHADQHFLALDLLHHPDTGDRWVLYSAEPVPVE